MHGQLPQPWHAAECDRLAVDGDGALNRREAANEPAWLKLFARRIFLCAQKAIELVLAHRRHRTQEMIHTINETPRAGISTPPAVRSSSCNCSHKRSSSSLCQALPMDASNADTDQLQRRRESTPRVQDGLPATTARP